MRDDCLTAEASTYFPPQKILVVITRLERLYETREEEEREHGWLITCSNSRQTVQKIWYHSDTFGTDAKPIRASVHQCSEHVNTYGTPSKPEAARPRDYGGRCRIYLFPKFISRLARVQTSPRTNTDLHPFFLMIFPSTISALQDERRHHGYYISKESYAYSNQLIGNGILQHSVNARDFTQRGKVSVNFWCLKCFILLHLLNSFWLQKKIT